MALTPVQNIYSPDDPNPWKLTTDLATMANSIEVAINKVAKGANLFIGTSAERAAAQATAKVGQHWQDTDGDKKRWIRGISVWEELSGGDYRIGTSAQRAGAVAKFGQIWQDSDGSKFKWVGRSDGTWTRSEGTLSVVAGAWAATAGSGVTALAGRTISWSVPCTVEPGETLDVSCVTAGTGYGWAALASTSASSGGSTIITVRQMQIMSTATQACVVTWKLQTAL